MKNKSAAKRKAWKVVAWVRASSENFPPSLWNHREEIFSLFPTVKDDIALIVKKIDNPWDYNDDYKPKINVRDVDYYIGLVAGYILAKNW
jgi:hypothetical protein